MDNFAINNIANMRWMLYGGMPDINMNCSNLYNNYMGGVGMGYNYALNNYNPAFKGYGNYNQDIFTKAEASKNDATSVNNIYKTATEGSSQVDWNNPQFRGLSDDLNELGDYYIKNSAPSESFIGAAVGGAVFGVLNNPRMVVHPWNSFRATKEVEKMFAAVKDEKSLLGKLWRNESKGGYEIVSNAYSRMHKLEALHRSKLGLFRKSIKGTPEGEALYKELKALMTNALASGDPEKIARATERLKRETNAFTGHVPRFMRWAHIDKPFVWLRKKFINPTHYEADIIKVADKAVTEAGAKTTFGQFMKHSCGVGNGLLFAGIEFAMDAEKIKTAFSKDSSTGWKQVRQTAIKGAGSAIGWAVGEGIGAFAGAKIGAALGTAVAPGLGTAIGAVAGLIGGSIGCWLAGKITHRINGQEAGTKVEVDNMKKTAQGQQQLLKLTLQQAEENKEKNKRTLQALNNVANFYGLV